MAEPRAIQLIAKILARANSDNQAEAEQALQGAYVRMLRDGVTFTELLSLPERDLYQDTLVRLADLIVKEQESLSPAARRTLYAEYLKRIVEKFSGSTQGRAGEGRSRSDADREREDAARTYEERRQQEEARRKRSQASPEQEQPKPEPPPHREPGSEKPFSRQNGFTAYQGVESPLTFDPSRFPFSFSPAAFFLFLFGADSFIGCIYSYPKRAFQLFLTSCLVGGITATVILVALAWINSALGFPPLQWLARLVFTPPAFGFTLIIFITAIVYYERGWYPRGPRWGETDTLTIVLSLWRLAQAVLWRAYGALVWGFKWKLARAGKGRGRQGEEKMAKRQNGESAEVGSGRTWYHWVMAALVSFVVVWLLVSAVFFLITWLLRFSLGSDAPAFVLNPSLYEGRIDIWKFLVSVVFTSAAVISVRRESRDSTKHS